MSNITNSTFKNFLWRFTERCSAHIVQIIVFVLLARILEPQDFGTIAILMVFINVLQVFIDSGLGTALIQKKNSNDIDFSSVFYFNVIICLFLYCLMYFSAPFIASFFNNLDLVSYIRVISFLLVISGIKNIQQAYVAKNMIFKKFFYSTLCGTITSAVIGIFMAYKGCGIWALIAQQLSNAAIDTLVLWFTVDWRPKFIFSWKRLGELLSYGWKLLVSAVIDTIYNNLRQLIIAKLYTPIELAFYNKGQQIPNLVIANINTSLDSILLPVMSKEQDNVEKVKDITRKSIQVSIYVIAPIMIGMGVTSYSFVPLILTEKWLPCIPFLWIFCITFIFWPIHTANLSALKALGRSDLFLKLEIWKKTVGMIFLLITMWHGVMVMAYSLLLLSILAQIINTWPNRKLLNYKYQDQIYDIIPFLLASCSTGCLMSTVYLLNLSQIATLLLQIATGFITYITISHIFKFEVYNLLLNQIKLILKK